MTGLTWLGLVLKSLAHHRRINGAVGLGIAAATAVLTGALLIGASLRQSLHDLTIERLGRVSDVIVAPLGFAPGEVERLRESLGPESRYTDVVGVYLTDRATAETDAIVPIGGTPPTVQTGPPDGSVTSPDADAAQIDPGSDSARERTRRSGLVTVLAADEAFWNLSAVDVRPKTLPGRGEVVLGETLARELGLWADTEAERTAIVETRPTVIVRLPTQSQASAETPLGRKNLDQRSLGRLTLVGLMPDRGFVRFRLDTTQAPPRTAIVSPTDVAEAIGDDAPGGVRAAGEAFVNTILLATDSPVRPAGEDDLAAAESAFSPSLATVGLELSRHRRVWPDSERGEPGPTNPPSPGARSAPAGTEAEAATPAEASPPSPSPSETVVWDVWDVTSTRMLIPPEAAEALRPVIERHRGQPVLTYLANLIAKRRAGPSGDEANASPNRESPNNASPESADGPDAVPYSLVTAIDPGAAFPLTDEAGGRLAEPGPNGLIVNAWLARRLELVAGDQVTVTYFLPDSPGGENTEATVDLTVAAVTPLTEPTRPYTRRTPARYGQPPRIANDPHLTPVVPGITDAESIESWDAPFPLDYPTDRDDDEYWQNYRTTPKGFVAYDTGATLFGSRHGTVTGYRMPGDAVTDEATLTAEIEAALRPAWATLGVIVRPVKREALAASSGSTPFDVLFLVLSMFLIGAAVLLIVLLVQLGLQTRGTELGVLAAVGFTGRRISGLYVAEALVVDAIAAVAGVALGVGWAWVMITGLSTVWLGAIQSPLLALHLDPVSLLAGGLGGLIVGALTVIVAIALLRRGSVRDLLAGRGAESAASVEPRAAWRSVVWAVVVIGAGVGGLALGGLAVTLTGEAQAGAFLGSGALLLVAMLGGVWRMLRRAARGDAGSQATTGKPTATGNLTATRGGTYGSTRLITSSVARNPMRTVLTVGLVGVASFLIVAVSSFRLESSRAGVGDFDVYAESAQPISGDLTRAAGRNTLLGAEAGVFENGSVVPLRLRPGDDASCNNLYQIAAPRVIGITPAFIARYDQPGVTPFSFASSAATTPDQRSNPWRLLAASADAGAVPATSDRRSNGEEPEAMPPVPVVIDQNTAVYSLKLYGGIGETFPIAYPGGPTVTFRVVGLLSGSLLQGSLLIGEADFTRLFPDQTGYRIVLTASERPVADQVAALERSLSGQGVDARPAEAVLEGYLAVQNTYIATFQLLGILGLLLGVFGVAAVQLRNVWERRQELALMRAVGFSRRRLLALVIGENAVLLLGGLLLGAAAAAVAIVPQTLLRGASPPWLVLTAMLAAVAVTGLAVAWWALSGVLNRSILGSLRSE